MANLFKINKGLILAAQATAPANPENGAIYYDSTLNQFRKYENGSWGTLGGDLSIQATAGENLTANQIVYISKGAADGSRTAGSAYLINPYNDDRVEFQGFVRDTVTIGQTATIVFGGVKTGFSSLTPGLPVYADPAVLGGITQTVNTTIGTWLINVGQATTTTSIRVNSSGAASSVYIDSLAQSNATILNNQASPLAISGMLFFGSTSAFVEYTINRSSSTTDFAQTGTITITKKPVAGTWTLTDTYSGDNAGVTFSIDSSGQIYYTSTNVGGTGYAGSLIFNTRDNGNSVVKFTPTQQRFTSGSGTYTLPTSPRPLYIRVRMVGGGGAGGAAPLGVGAAGTATTFGTSLLTASNGAGGSSVSGGAGGAATVNSPAFGTGLTGGAGTGAILAPASDGEPGGAGGNSAFGGGGGGTKNASGTAGATNTGGGGGGGGGGANNWSGSGGGAGGFVDAVITSPSATYAYTVGAGGTGSGTGASGGSGYIEVTEYYQ